MPMHIEGYPRPQFVRPDWESWNGVWSFAFDDADEGEAKGWFNAFPMEGAREIVVPFSYETKASGIGEEDAHPVVWYRRVFTAGQTDKRVILHFEGSDYRTKVWVNGKMAGTHTGGYTRFSFDITALLCEGENDVVVRVEDSYEVQQPRGKQRWRKESFACWYVQTTGIWKSVWLEYAPKQRLDTVKLTPQLVPAMIKAEWKLAGEDCIGLNLRMTITLAGRRIAQVTQGVQQARGVFDVRLGSNDWGGDPVHYWSPENPVLYDVTFELLADGQAIDTVYSYFGLREVSIANGKVLLNGQPYYQRLLLDQGYWADSHLTSPDDAALLLDVEKTKAMGFNGVRKHQKVEDERFYYYCDVKGLLAWSEMPSPYAYGDDMVESFMTEWMSVVRMHYNHPCVVTWTPINESWGVPQVSTDAMQQHFTEAVYYVTKAFDPMRPVIVNDGWEHTISDILTLHDYEETGEALYTRYTQGKDAILSGTIAHNGGWKALAEGYAYAGQPIIMSEYGGAAYTASKQGEAWGYGNGVADEEALLARIDDVTTAIMRLPYVCGFCYTQTTDVQQEVNGLMDEKRQCKADEARLRAIFGKPVPPVFE